jgi:hypothetical protein
MATVGTAQKAGSRELETDARRAEKQELLGATIA